MHENRKQIQKQSHNITFQNKEAKNRYKNSYLDLTESSKFQSPKSKVLDYKSPREVTDRRKMLKRWSCAESVMDTMKSVKKKNELG